MSARRVHFVALSLVIPHARSQTLCNEDVLRRNGTNVVVSGASNDVSYEYYADLPDLPEGIRSSSYGVPLTPDNDGKYAGFDGVIKLGGVWSLTPGTSWYGYSQQMRRAQQMAIDFINLERGGITAGGKKYGVHAFWMDDQSSKQLVTNATAHAGRGWGADFMLGGYSSGVTTYTTKQSYADGYILVAPGAASTSVFTQNDHTFGTFVPASSYFKATLQGLAEKAAAVDADSSSSPFASRCTKGGASSCVEAIKVGFLQASATFTKSMCADGGANAAAVGLATAKDAEDNALTVTIPKVPSEEETLEALKTLKDAGVTVIISCTYSQTGNAMIAGLVKMNWAPLTVAMSSTVGLSSYAAKIAAPGGYVNEYVIGYSIWQAARQGVGSFTGWTSQDFEDKFMARFEDTKPSYHGASAFTSVVVLGAAIEAAGTLTTSTVVQKIREMSVSEFYANIAFDANGQLSAEMMTIQFGPNRSKQAGATVDIIYPPAVSSAEWHFPMPDWPIRHCWATCNDASGHCSEEGKCVCDDGFQGENCGERVVVVEDKTRLYFLALFIGCILALQLSFGLWRFYIFIKKALKLKKEDEKRRVKRCQEAIKSAVTLQSSAYLVKFSDFKKFGKLIVHEEARTKGLLHTIDDYEDLVTFTKENPVVFLSHQWLAWSDPDPDRIQYEQMMDACRILSDKNGYDPSDLYIFLDILSIPQKNLRQRGCAIETLGALASIFKHFVIIAPTAVHKDTKVVCNKESYSRRGWCRLEQWGHLCLWGMEEMYFYNNNKLESLDDTDADWFRDSIMVLGGDFTNPESKGELVTTILGLYGLVLNSDSSYSQKLRELIEQHYKEVFPHEHFEDLPELMKKILDGTYKAGRRRSSLGEEVARIDGTRVSSAEQAKSDIKLLRSVTQGHSLRSPKSPHSPKGPEKSTKSDGDGGGDRRGSRMIDGDIETAHSSVHIDVSQAA